MQTQNITIQGTTFVAPAPYSEGHVLTAVEAAVLNQTFGENLRNNFAQKLKKREEEIEEAKKNGGTAPAPLGQADFDAYASKYEFGVRPTRETDPVLSEAKKLAEKEIREKIKAKGVQIKSLPEGRLDELVAQAIEKHPRFLEQAKIIVAARQSAAAASAGELELAL